LVEEDEECDGLSLARRLTMVSLTEFCDVVAFFVSKPDSTISPSEGVDGDLDLRDAMMGNKEVFSFFLGQCNGELWEPKERRRRTVSKQVVQAANKKK
jgi:hypothetical protein